MKPIHPFWRFIFLSGGGLSLVASTQLLVLPEQTELYLAWTIQSPLTAAIIGAFFFGTMTFSFIAFREQATYLARMLAIGLAGSMHYLSTNNPTRTSKIPKGWQEFRIRKQISSNPEGMI